MRSIIRLLNKVEEYTLVFVLLTLAFLSCIEVFCRYCLGFSFTWSQELARYVGVFVVFLGASLGVKYGTHFSMDLVYERVSSHRFRHGLRMVASVLSAGMFLIVAWYGWIQTDKLRHYEALTAVFQLPKYWFYLPVPVFSVIISIRFLILAVKHLGGLVRNEPFSMMKQES